MSQPAQRTYRYYDLIMASFVCVDLCSNLIGVGEVTEVGTSLGSGPTVPECGEGWRKWVGILF